MAIQRMTAEEAQEHLRKARNKVEPGTFISNRPPIKQDKADPNGPGFPNPLFADGKLSSDKLPESRPSEDRVKPAKMPNPGTTYDAWLADARKLSGKFQHSRQDDATRRAYKPAATDVSGVAASALADASRAALNADTAEERESSLSRCMDMLHIACVSHEALKGSPLD